MNAAPSATSAPDVLSGRRAILIWLFATLLASSAAILTRYARVPASSGLPSVQPFATSTKPATNRS